MKAALGIAVVVLLVAGIALVGVLSLKDERLEALSIDAENSSRRLLEAQATIEGLTKQIARARQDVAERDGQLEARRAGLQDMQEKLSEARSEYARLGEKLRECQSRAAPKTEAAADQKPPKCELPEEYR